MPAHLRTPLAALAAGLTLATLSGCLISGSKDVTVTGTPISEQTLAAIEPDLTSEEQLLEMLGPPTRTMAAETGTIYVYEFQRRTRGGAAVFLVLSSGSDVTERTTTYALVKDGYVRRIWRDEAAAL